MKLNKISYLEFGVLNFLFSLVCAFLGFSSRLNNIFGLDESSHLEHILAGLGAPSFLVAISLLCSDKIINRGYKGYRFDRVLEFKYFIIFFSSIVYVCICFISEFLKYGNKYNHFSIDMLGIFIFILGSILFLRNKQLVSSRLIGN